MIVYALFNYIIIIVIVRFDLPERSDFRKISPTAGTKWENRAKSGKSSSGLWSKFHGRAADDRRDAHMSPAR